jgi:HEAT repeat protein
MNKSTASVALLAAVMAISNASARASEKEQELINVLRSGAPAEKAMACKQLAIYGSSEAVPELARLLSDEKLASWSRIALEAIPGDAANEALRKAAESLQGKLLIGAINSLGVRRDAAAVDSLTRRLKDPDADVAAAAALALGRVGNAAAARSLRPALVGTPAAVRSAVAEGCVLCAERFLAEGNAALATEIYDEVRKADVPRQRMLEATRGAILARKDAGIPLLLEQLRSADKALFQLGLSTAREVQGSEVDQVLAAEVESAASERAALVILAMADRPKSVLVPALVKAAGRGQQEVRLAAIDALGRVGNATSLDTLLEAAVEADPDLAQAAKTALGELPDANADKEIVARLAKAEGKTYPVLLELVGRRRIDAVALLIKALSHSDKAVRSAALMSLGATVTPKDLSVLISQVVTPTYAEDLPAAQQALKAAAVRMPDREACAAELTGALERSPAATRSALLEILGAVGGTKALATVGAAAKGSDPQLQDVGSRLLGEWMTIDAAPVLLDLAKSSDRYQGRALRGYVRIARQFTMPDQQRIEMCAHALAAARQPAEQKLVLEVVQRYPSVGMLKVAVQAAQLPDV